VLVDTSVWIDHLRRGNRRLVEQLEAGDVLTHPFVIGEIACGHLRNRSEILALLGNLVATPAAEHAEVMAFVDAHELMGQGLGWVDMHLLASAALAATPLWTLDRRLSAAADSLGLRRF
jgi:predicted nucleic acid-binding protein